MATIKQRFIDGKAKIDIVDVEANVKIIEAAFKAIDKTIQSTGLALDSILKLIAKR